MDEVDINWGVGFEGFVLDEWFGWIMCLLDGWSGWMRFWELLWE